MRPALLTCLIFLSCAIVQPSSAQNGDQLTALIDRADSLYKAKNYDSALVVNFRALLWLKENKPDRYQFIEAARVMLNTGKCYWALNNFAGAHKYFNYSLQQSRANKSDAAIAEAFTELNRLHRYIRDNNLPFSYPALNLTEETDMFFSIRKVEPVSKDSLRITIGAGRYDGLSDSVTRGAIISRFNDKEPERPFGLVNCYIRGISDNSCIAMAVNNPAYPVKEGDIVELKARVPLSWQKLAVSKTLRYGIGFSTNYREPVFDPRYLYYYTDSLTNREIALVMKYQIDEIVEVLGEDTLQDGYAKMKGSKGIFADENIMKAMSRSTGEHLALFLGFVNAYPRKYIGNNYKFAEVYATWVVNNTPLALPDVRGFLLGIPHRDERQRMAKNLAEEISGNNLTDQWFDEGMLMANGDNLDSAMYIAGLIRDAGIALLDSSRMGWADYLEGFIGKKLSNRKKADSLYHSALRIFRNARNKEGETWALNAIDNLAKSEKIRVNLQTGHLFPYIMAPSPNSRYLATGGVYDKYIKIWDLILGKEIFSFAAHEDDINSLHYSPNGRYLVSASEDRTIKIWNAYDFTLLKTIKTKRAELDVIFSPDSKQLVAGGRDSLVKFYDPNNGAITRTLALHKAAITGLRYLPSDTQYLFSSGLDSMIYKWDLATGKMDHWYKEKGKVLGLSVSNNGKYMLSVSTDSVMNVWDLDHQKFFFKTRVNTFVNGDYAAYAMPGFSPDSKLIAFARTRDSLTVFNISTYQYITYGKKKDDYSFFDVTFSPDGNYLAVRQDIGGPLRLYNFSDWDFFRNSGTLRARDIKSYYNLPTTVQFTRDDNGLVIVSDGISKIDLRNGSTNFLYHGYLAFRNNYILLNDEKTGIYQSMATASLDFWDYAGMKVLKSFGLPDTKETLKQFELSGDNQYLFLAGAGGTIVAFDIPAWKKIFAGHYRFGTDSGFNALRYDSLRQKLYVVGQDNRIGVLDARSGKIIDSLIANKPQTIEVSDRFLYVTCANSEVYKYDAATRKLLKKIKVNKSGNDCVGSVMSGDYRYFVAQFDNTFAVIDTRTDQVLYEKYDHDYANGIMSVSHDGKRLATSGFDSKVNLYDLATGRKTVTIYTPRQKDYMITDDDGYYLASRNTLEAVNFSYNNNSYGFEQFDARFNRPDKILKTLGRADSSLVNLYYAAWKKRLKKLNLDENALNDDVHLPVIRLKEKYAIKPATSLSEYELNIECFDAKYPLQSVQVLVNNSPLFGTAGKQIPGNLNKSNLSVKIPLSTGGNLVKVYCTNSKGATSLSETIEINSSYQPSAPAKTYFIGIAVSNYRDSSMNLRFAAKDVRDLAGMFGRLFKNTETDTLIDAMATRENILRLREKLMNTTVNDKVIISVNGHGLLSDSLDFYYATWDVDFKKPEGRGLKYEDLEALLDGIPARKKLVLIDACHSGALDREELIALQKKDTVQAAGNPADTGSVKGFASRGTIVKSSQAKVDANSAYEVMQNLFADLKAGNGAVIISAAGGMEYAFESDTWNNGVFTYCIRKGIEEEMADKEAGNFNSQVEVDELKTYVSRKVSELTGGRQRPVSRRENIEFNWVVW